jgi:hypothetical protein
LLELLAHAAQLFDRSYASLTALSPAKPVMIADTASLEQGGDKADWIKDLYDTLPTAYPKTRAIAWFQADTTSGGEPDWRILT